MGTPAALGFGFDTPSAVALAAALMPALADAALKGALVLSGAYALTRWGMRHAAAATRHLVWAAAVGAVLALPGLALVTPRWTLPLVPAAAAERAVRVLAAAAPAGAPVSPTPAGVPAPAHTAASGHPAFGIPEPAPVATRAVVSAGAGRVSTGRPPASTQLEGAQPAAAEAAPGWPLWAAAAWAAGALLALARFALGTVGLARLARRARPAEDPAWVAAVQRLARELGVRRPVTLLVGRAGTVPVTWGVVYPVVLLPADADVWGEERRRLVLLHELAHVARLDALTQLLARLAGALFWFNPLVALAARRLRAERERACDDLVLGAGVRATAYADDLLDLVRTLGAASPASAALAMARRSEFEGRLLAILDPTAPRARTSARRALAAAALAGVVALPLAGVRAAVAGRGTPARAGEALIGGQMSSITTTAAVRGARAVASSSGVLTAGAVQPASAGDVPPVPADDTRASVRGVPLGLTVPLPPVPPGSPLPPTPSRLGGPTVDGCGGEPSQTVVRDGASRVSTYRSVADGHCLEVYVRGDVDFTDDYADVRAAAPGGAVVVTESGRGATRRMVVTPEGDALARRYTLDGAPRPAGEGGAWFRRVLTDVVARGDLGVTVRTAQLRRTGGVGAVLDAARQAATDAERQRYLEALLGGPALSEAELERVAVAARWLTGDAARATVLRRVAARGAGNAGVVAAVVGGARTLTADGARRRVLEQTAAGPALPPAVLADLARAAGGITSEGDKAAVLARLAPRITASDAVRAAYFEAVASMTSDTDRRRVLLGVLDAPRDPAVLAAVLDALAPMTSDGDRTAVLTAVAARQPLEPPSVRQRYFARVDAMTSEASRERALLAPLERGPASEPVVRAVLASAGRLTSDRTRANVLVGVAERTDALHAPASRAAFLAALRPITSGGEYRRVMEAVIPH